MRKRRQGRLGRLLFILPIVVILIAVMYQIFSYYTVQQGTLVVNAETSNRYYPARLLNATISVAGVVRNTPTNLSLGAGVYTVTFSPLQWYHSPADRQIDVLAGRTAYAWGIYSPLVAVVEINQAGLNATKISALHGVTPVVWVNKTDKFTVLLGDVFNQAVINPGQNFTTIYQGAGTYGFSISGTSNGGTVQVA